MSTGLCVNYSCDILRNIIYDADDFPIQFFTCLHKYNFFLINWYLFMYFTNLNKKNKQKILKMPDNRVVIFFTFHVTKTGFANKSRESDSSELFNADLFM